MNLAVRSLAAVAFVLLAALAVAPPAPAQTNYVVGASDVLTITVWDQPDVSGKFTVEADGSFTFPLIGRVKVAGLTLRQVEEEIRKRLADGYFRNPQVSAAVEQYRSQRVFVLGEVRQPGPQPLTGDMTLIEALSRAGSTLPGASGELVVVRAPADHKADGPVLPNQRDDTESVRVDLRALQEGTPGLNLALRDGDTVFVPRAETIYVFGQVRNPGAYAMQTRDTTVLQALSLAGGVTDRGAMNRTRIVRIVDGKKQDLKVKMTDLVRPGDTIIVPVRYF